MTRRHSPTLVADRELTEKPKRPKKVERVKKEPMPLAKHKEDEGPPPGSVTPSVHHAPSPPTPTPTATTQTPEPLSTPVLPVPSSNTTDPQSTDTTAATAATARFGPRQPVKDNNPPGGYIRVNGVDFHHASEAEFARLLTYYGIEWEYEPQQFPLQWRDGRPTEMFTPDFYLTEYDLYIELTTMRQSLVRRKNRKLRLLRALYPEISIKLLYRRDYQRLLERFGIRHEDVEAEHPLPFGMDEEALGEEE